MPRELLTVRAWCSIENDVRQSAGKKYYEYWVALLPQPEVSHKVNLTWENKVIDIPPSTAMELYETRQWTYETKDPVPLESFGATTRGPIGWRVLGRSGDKAAGANAGPFVENEDGWD